MANRPSVYVHYDQARLRDVAQQLARALDLPLGGAPAEDAYRLQLLADPVTPGYRLLLQPPGKQGAVEVDFISGSFAHRLRFGGGRGQALARAMGLRGAQAPVVLDATAGLGRDAFLFAWLGCRVTCSERSPLIGALLRVGLERARHHEVTAEAAARIELVLEDAGHLLGHGDRTFDVIYLDPMFPERQTSALSRKEARLLRELVGEDADAAALLQQARRQARQRVVVKRPMRAAPLGDATPSHRVTGKTTRYDVYMTNLPKTPM